MNFHWIDWTVVAALMGVLVVMALISNRYTRSVADYLAGGRCAGRRRRGAGLFQPNSSASVSRLSRTTLSGY